MSRGDGHLGGVDPLEGAARSRALAEIRDSLRSFETSELAGVAAHLAEAAERLLEASEKLSRPISEDWYTLERAAKEMGFVDEKGEAQKTAFSMAMQKKGVKRAKLSGARIYYRREDLDELLRGLKR